MVTYSSIHAWAGYSPWVTELDATEHARTSLLFKLRGDCYLPNPLLFILLPNVPGFPSSSDSKASACNVGDPGLIPGLGRSPGEGNGNPLQYSCLENSMDRGTWWDTVPGVIKSQT